VTKCNSCNYEWETKSKKDYVSCPNCLNKAKVNKVENALIIGEELDMTTKTTLKFTCYDKTLAEYPLRGFDKGQVKSIKKMLSNTNNVPTEDIEIEID